MVNALVKDDIFYSKVSKEMSSLYFRLGVFCLFGASVSEFGTRPLPQKMWKFMVGFLDEKITLKGSVSREIIGIKNYQKVFLSGCVGRVV